MGINSAFGSDIDSARGDAWHDADWRVDGNWHDVPDGRHDGWYAAHERSDDGFVHSMVKLGGRRTCASDRSPGSKYLACVSDSGKEPSHSMFLASSSSRHSKTSSQSIIIIRQGRYTPS